MKEAKADWVAIERVYCAGQKPSVNAIAKEYGVSEGAIRKRAKKEGWVRDPAGTQRELVKAHFSGSTNSGTNFVPGSIKESAHRAIAIEERALANAELVLDRIHAALDSESRLDSADLKRLSEANKINLDTARTIFNLNEPGGRPGVEYVDAPFPD
jgi:hypothetical protein